jgi:hypothetical protein
MTDANGWPDPERPGVPLNPERDGWHWLSGATETPAALEWRYSVTGLQKRGWYLHRAQHGLVYADEMAHWRYLGPALTPAEVAAQIAAAVAAEREACARWHDAEADDYWDRAKRWAANAIESKWNAENARDHERFAAAIRARGTP